MRFNDLRIRMKILLGATSIVLITGMLGVLAYVYIGKISGTLFSITENNAKSVEFATGVERKALETLLAIRFFRVFDVSCGIHASKSWVMGAPIR